MSLIQDERSLLLSKLDHYQPFDDGEAAMLNRMRQFIDENPDCFKRELQIGHITGSAWVVNPAWTHTLLTHHVGLGRWLQMGGHSDGDPDTLAVALREVEEESGLTDVEVPSQAIFDIDVHAIPARGSEPDHYHYDVRFLMVADDTIPLRISDESHDLLWVQLDEVERLNPERSMVRMVEKCLRI